MKETALILIALLVVIATSAGTTVATAYFAPDLLPQGEHGLQGPQGKPGVMGPRGLPGEDGRDGTDGVDAVDATTSTDEHEDLREELEANTDADRDRLCSRLYDEGDFSSEAWRNECSGGRW